MAVFRVEKNGNYTVMSNYHLDDRRLSLKAVGLLSRILRLPPDWDFTIEGLAAISKDGIASVRSGIVELEAAGYIRRGQTHLADGTFGGNDYTVYEKPPDMAPLCENRTTDAPSCDFPSAENPSADFRRQINTKLPSTNEPNPPKAPQGAEPAKRTSRGAKEAPDWEPLCFARFWKAYPCGKDKQAAIREWDRLKPDHALMRIMSAALVRDKNSDEWRRGIGIPYACRWLRNRRWEDEQHGLPGASASSGWAEDPEVFG